MSAIRSLSWLIAMAHSTNTPWHQRLHWKTRLTGKILQRATAIVTGLRDLIQRVQVHFIQPEGIYCTKWEGQLRDNYIWTRFLGERRGDGTYLSIPANYPPHEGKVVVIFRYQVQFLDLWDGKEQNNSLFEFLTVTPRWVSYLLRLFRRLWPF